MTVYLLHFNEPYCHARHYLGSTDDLDNRLQEHRTGQGARLTQVIHNAGISFILARTWEGGHDLQSPETATLTHPYPPPIQALEKPPV